jgi:hypothetical protein
MKFYLDATARGSLMISIEVEQSFELKIILFYS